MIETAVAVEISREAINGRTGPLVTICETDAGEFVELFCKFSSGCDQGVTNLAREIVAVCLAADLRLPVPKPYIVSIPSELIPTISDSKIASKVASSVPVVFGSQRVNQFSVWSIGNKVNASLLQTAAATLVFDGIIQNPDRRVGNPNCLVKGDEVRLIDHELALAHGVILLWKAPWIIGGMESLTNLGNRHIFLDDLKGKQIDFDPITNAWKSLSDERINEYVMAIPEQWAAALPEINAAVRLIADARDHIDSCIAEVRRILS